MSPALRPRATGMALALALAGALAGCTAPGAATDASGGLSTAEVIARTRLAEVGPTPSSSAYQDAVDRSAADLSGAGLSEDDAVTLAVLDDAEVRALLAREQRLSAAFVAELAAARGAPDAAAPEWIALRLALQRAASGGPREAYGIAYAEAAPAFVAAAERGRLAWLDAVAARQSEALLDGVTASLAAEAELANEQLRAGTIDRGAHAERQLAYAEALRAQAEAAKETVVTREALVRTLGLWGASAAPKLPDRLPDLPSERPSFADAEDHAVAHRLDLVAARRSGTSRAKAVVVRSEARETLAILLLSYDVARHQQQVVVPQSAIALEAAQRAYNGMLIGVYDLLAAVRVQIEAGRGYVATLSDYWRADAAFRAALGGERPHSAPRPAAAASLESTP